MEIQELLPIPWYIAGPLIGLTIPLLYYFIDKPLGISYSFKQICAVCIPGKSEKVLVNQKLDAWRLYFVGGLILSGILHHFLIGEYTINISAATKESLTELGLQQNIGFIPKEIWSINHLTSAYHWALIIVGGLLIGFGTRYAGGCTSGHTIMGISNLSAGSLLATIGFFLGGLISAWFILPYLIQLL